ncbi:MAG: FecR domain-containing protein [Chitinophagaceae bacterium]
MQSGDKRLEELYTKWLNKTATPQEKAALIELLASGVSREQLTPLMEKVWNELKDDNGFSNAQRQELADNILKQWPAGRVVTAAPRVRLYRRAWAAAIVLLAGAGITWMLLSDKNTKPQQLSNVTTATQEVIAPGKDGAVLTLADGRKIVLDSAGNGIIGSEAGAQISLHNNQIVYNTNAGDTSTVMLYNTMYTPKGRQFQLVLPDGSRVWLNAASTIRYPVAFSSKERRVELNGEAYFEVAHDKNWPFYVQTKNQQVQALGTSFNVNAFEEEATEKTTLIEGSVEVNALTNNQPEKHHPLSAILHPGQQAKLDYHNQHISVANNQSEAAIAWKNGYFSLENLPFDQVMRQLERWYDIQVVYESGVPDLHFVGGISRNMTLAALIRALQVSEVHFKIEAGRRLIVYK